MSSDTALVNQQADKQEIVSAKQFTPEEIGSLGIQLGACLVVQRTYGKQGGDIEAMTRVFAKDLEKFPAVRVIKALEQWRLKSPEFPTPADICNLLNPTPVWSAAVFQELVERRKKGEVMSYSEEEYIKGYRKHAISGV